MSGSARLNDNDIAIVGMACLFPAAPDVATFWTNVVNRVNAITDPPAEAWDLAAAYDPESAETDRIYCQKGGFIGPLASFNPLKHGIMPNVVEGAEPDQWLALEIARQALTDAGYGDEIPEGNRAAVIIGRGTYLNRGNTSHYHHGALVAETLDVVRRLHPEYTAEEIELIRHELRRHLVPFNAATAQGLIPNIIAGRIANKFDLMGPSYTVDAACASSLIALEHAVKGLRHGEFDLALVGGAHVVSHAPIAMVFSQLQALSRQGIIRPFDAEADGTILGEGVGMVVIKRLSDAVRDGQRVYAVIKGVGTASDGHGLSVMAPRLEGQVLAMRRAYASTDVEPDTIGLIEAHGTGTAVGDATEIQSLRALFGERPGGPKVAISAVKSMIGHLMPAAGMAGLIKTSLALYHKVLPPTLNVSRPNPELQLEETPFYLNTEARPWIHGDPATPRRAGVNAFGFGGINAHVVLEEFDQGPRTKDQGRPVGSNRFSGLTAKAVTTNANESLLQQWESEVVIVSAGSRASLVEEAAGLAAKIGRRPELRLKDVAYTLNVARPLARHRLAVVAADAADLARKLERAVTLLQEPNKKKINDTRGGIYYFEERLAEAGKLAFVFPGEGSQYVNMLADLCRHFPEVRASFDQVDRLVQGRPGDSRGLLPSERIFPYPAFTPEEQAAAEARLWQMDGAVEAVLTANQALLGLLTRLGIRPNAILGHSSGEYSALIAAGMIDVDDEERLAAFAAGLNAVHEAAGDDEAIPSATLLACAASAETLQSLAAGWGDDLFIGMDNCPHQCVVIGREPAVTALIQRLNEQGIIYERLAFDRPYHTPLFADFSGRLRGFLDEWLTGRPPLPVYSCTVAGRFPDDLDAARQMAADHWQKPVLFRQTIQRMVDDGTRIFVEVGPRGNLSAFIGDVLRGQKHVAIPADVSHRSGITQLNHLVAVLAAHGVPMDLDTLYARRAPQVVDLAAGPQPERGRMKLATNPRPMTISEEVAAQLRQKRSAVSPQPPAIGQKMPAEASAPIPDLHVNGGQKAASRQPSALSGQLPQSPISNLQSPLPSPIPHPPSPASQVMSAYLQTMDQFLLVQEEVMRAFLTEQKMDGRPPAADHREQATDNNQPTITDNHQPPDNNGYTTGNDPAVGGRPSAVGPQSPASLYDALLAIVSDLTGYPAEMVGLDMDLEADLGIDSIKRVEILGSFQKQHGGVVRPEQMDALTSQKTLRQIVTLIETGEWESNGVAKHEDLSGPRNLKALEPSLYPFVREIISHSEDELVVACQLSLDEDIFLYDHTLGRHISLTDPELTGLPVMPMTAVMEILAEAAAALVPDQKLVGMQDVFVYRWLVVTGRLQTKLVAKKRSAVSGQRSAVEVTLTIEGEESPIARGTMILDSDYPAAPEAAPLALSHERPGQWAAGELYERSAMFHGPRFQGVVSLDRVGDDGATGTLRILPRGRLFASNPSPNFVIDPVLFDQVGQVVGFWGLQTLPEGTIMAPYHLRELQFYRPFGSPRLERSEVMCQARIEAAGPGRLRSDLDVFSPDGTLWMRWLGWEDQTFDAPPTFFALAFGGAAGRDLSEAWPVAVVGGRPSAVALRRATMTMVPLAFFTGAHGIWMNVLACAVLGRQERALWHSLKMPAERRLQWLLARIAAKDLLRDWLKETRGLELLPADVEILPDEQGRPVAQGAWAAGRVGAVREPPLPAVSLAHSGEVAVAAMHPQAAGIGVDVERRGHFPAEGVGVAFSEAEQSLIAGLPAGDEWQLRCWCAKEAVAKALGQGLVNGPRRLEIASVAAETGEVTVRVAAGDSLTAHTCLDGDCIVAVVIRD